MRQQASLETPEPRPTASSKHRPVERQTEDEKPNVIAEFGVHDKQPPAYEQLKPSASRTISPHDHTERDGMPHPNRRGRRITVLGEVATGSPLRARRAGLKNGLRAIRQQ